MKNNNDTSPNKIDEQDFEILRSCYNAKQGDSNFKQECDLNNDGIVNLVDFGILAKEIKK